ncbi:MAG: DUF4399 domain-containing protein [Actinomycetota bacterium]|nr:DUF4399 domain-containing protein [Actinomycetota bacterium]
MKQRRWWRPVVLVGAVLMVSACGGDDEEGTQQTPGPVPTAATEATDEVSVSFARPEDGATVTSPVRVQMQSTGILIGPVAEAREDTGHFDIMVDVGCVTPGQEIPNDEQHLHFGDGGSTAEIELEPGEHTLCLQASTNDHIAYDATDEITITVE